VADGTEGVKVNAVIAVIAEDGEDAATVDVIETPVADKRPAQSNVSADAPADTSTNAPAPAQAPTVAATMADKTNASAHLETTKLAKPSSRVFASPLARRIAEQNGRPHHR